MGDIGSLLNRLGVFDLQNNANLQIQTLGNNQLQNALQSQQYNQQYITHLATYPIAEEDILSPEYIRKEWDVEMCRVMGWTMAYFCIALSLMTKDD